VLRREDNLGRATLQPELWRDLKRSLPPAFALDGALEATDENRLAKTNRRNSAIAASMLVPVTFRRDRC